MRHTLLIKMGEEIKARQREAANNKGERKFQGGRSKVSGEKQPLN